MKSDAKVAENDKPEAIPGMPDLPKDNPLYDFFKQFRKGMPQQQQKPSADARRKAPASSSRRMASS